MARWTAALMLVCIARLVTAQPALESDQDKTLYALGVALGSNIEPFALTAEEFAIVSAGMRDAALGEAFRVDMEVYGPQIQQLASARAAAASAGERAAAAAFVDEMALEPGAEQLASGLVHIPVAIGSGARPTANDTVRVHYHGTLRDGTVFDSSVARGEPNTFALNSVIPCFTEGVQLIAVGGKSKLVCPPDLAYGDRSTGDIPAGAALVFEIELLGIE